jgi:hypothetical protein
MRKVEIVHLTSPHSTDIDDFTRIVPATGPFDDAFTAFARGTLLHTDRGQMSVEDLLPGDKVRTVDAGFQTLLWRGTTVLSALAQGQDPAMGQLTRIAADTLGIARPMPDLVLGPRARLVHRSNGVRVLTGQESALILARDFIDGVNVVSLTPPTTVPAYHLGFSRSSSTSNGTPGSSLAQRITRLVFTLATLSAFSQFARSGSSGRCDRSGATHFRMKSISPFSM